MNPIAQSRRACRMQGSQEITAPELLTLRPEMVPIRPFVAEFAGKYAGFTCQEVTHDFDKAFVAARKCAADFDWDDVGAWPAAARHMKEIGDGNVSRGRALVENGSGNIIVSDSDHLVALIGCDNLVVVHTGDATLVCPKDESQSIKDLVKRLGANESDRKLL